MNVENAVSSSNLFALVNVNMSPPASAILTEASGNPEETRLLIQDGDDGDGQDSREAATADAPSQRIAPASIQAPQPSSRSRRSSAVASDFVFIKVVARIALQV